MGTVINRIITKDDFENMGTLTIPTLTLNYAQFRWFKDLLYIFEPTALNKALHQYDKNFIETLPTNLGITCIAQPLFDMTYLYQVVEEKAPANLVSANFHLAGTISQEQFTKVMGFSENIQGEDWPWLYNPSTGEIDAEYKFIVPTDEQLGKDIAASYDLAEGLLFNVALPQTYSWPLVGEGAQNTDFWRQISLTWNTNLLTFTIPIGDNDAAFPPTDDSTKYMIPKLFVPYLSMGWSGSMRNPTPIIYWFGVKEIN